MEAILIAVAGTAGLILIGLFVRERPKFRTGAMAAVVLGCFFIILLYCYLLGIADVMTIMTALLYAAAILFAGLAAALLIAFLLDRRQVTERRRFAGEAGANRGQTTRASAKTEAAEQPQTAVQPATRKAEDMAQLKSLVADKNHTAAYAKAEQMLHAGYKLDPGETRQLETIKNLLKSKMGAGQ